MEPEVLCGRGLSNAGGYRVDRANGAVGVSKEGEEVRSEEHSLAWLGASLIIHRTDVIESQEFSELEGT